MSFRIWIKCPKGDVKANKNLLESRGLLFRGEKIRENIDDGLKLIPTVRLCKVPQIEKGFREALLRDLLPLSSRDLHSDVILVSLPSESNDSGADGVNGIRNAVSVWLQHLPSELVDSIALSTAELLSYTPKRWSIYRTLVLLPSGSFQSEPWHFLLKQVALEERNTLWLRILDAIGKVEGGQALTHLAVNSGIPLDQQHVSGRKTENVLRSPTSLLTLYGDFGPNLSGGEPNLRDFETAFWVNVKQNGVFQTWAPLYTIFSRGNIKEKGRIMTFHKTGLTQFPRRAISRRSLGSAIAVDLYAGIGYFTFSYVAMGIGKVLCWEINPWSIEGLQRERSIWDKISEEDRIIVFQESNEHASRRIDELRNRELTSGNLAVKTGDIIHVNCGFLPSSEASWKTAWHLLSTRRAGWLHLHENVGAADIESRRQQIGSLIGEWAAADPTSSHAEVEHVELVKTFAPGVWHCVFDVYVARLVPES